MARHPWACGESGARTSCRHDSTRFARARHHSIAAGIETAWPQMNTEGHPDAGVPFELRAENQTATSMFDAMVCAWGGCTPGITSPCACRPRASAWPRAVCGARGSPNGSPEMPRPRPDRASPQSRHVAGARRRDSVATPGGCTRGECHPQRPWRGVAHAEHQRVSSSYSCRSRRVAGRALKIRTLDGARSVYMTASSRPNRECPKSTRRCSTVEWRSSRTVRASGSRKAVLASSKVTLCLIRLRAAFAASQVKSNCMERR